MAKTEYARYIHSSAWRTRKGKRLDLDGHTCQVCGKEAKEVHHLTYERFGNEEMGDLVSLCTECHRKAEEIYSGIPWAMNANDSNFMAAMRVDAVKISQVVYDYLHEARGSSFEALMELRKPERKTYWVGLKRAVNALCRKRYSLNCVEDRADIMMGAVTSRVTEICLQEMEHRIRNRLQEDLHEIAVVEHMIFGTWKGAAEDLGITQGTISTLKSDDGTSYGPSLREEVLYYCGLDAAAGIHPLEGFECLSAEDYQRLNEFADYFASVSGTGKFRGEYIC